MKINQTPATETSTIRVLKTSQCSSLSGRSTLTYTIGCDTENKIYIRIIENSGAGLFSKEWTHIVLPDDKVVTSGTLHSLCQGKSANTAGFLLSILIHEGLINIVSEKPRKYEKNDSVEFNKQMQALMDSDTQPSKPAKVNKKETSSPASQGDQS